MKKLLQFSLKAFIAMLIMAMPLMMYGQDAEPEGQEPEKKKETFDGFFFINANVGAMLYHGDITDSEVIPSTEHWNLGYGLGLGYQICPVFGLRLNYLGGKLSGQKDEGYIRVIPVDPITGSDETWQPVYFEEEVEEILEGEEAEGIWDVRSGAQGEALDGTFYYEW